MQFTKEFLLRVIFEDFFSDEGIKIISDKIVDKRRWVVERVLIFKYQDKYFRVEYDQPSTEGQDGCGYWDYCSNDELIDVTEVRPVEKTIIVYE